jgi:hypothetical protein
MNDYGLKASQVVLVTTGEMWRWQEEHGYRTANEWGSAPDSVREKYCKYIVTLDRWRRRRVYGWHRLGTIPLLPLPGIYAVFENGKCIYIGSSLNLKARIGGKHEHRNGQRRCRFRYVFGTGEYLRAECRLIRRLRPKLNQAHMRERPTVEASILGYPRIPVFT